MNERTLSPEAIEAGRALEQTLAAERAISGVLWLANRAPHRKHTHERLGELLVELRAFGVDVLAAVRQAQHRMDELQLEAAVPIENTGSTPTSTFRLVDTEPTAKDD